MKVLLLNTYDLSGGAARAVYRLHRGLKTIGLDSRLVVQQKSGDRPDVSGPGSFLKEFMTPLRLLGDSLFVRHYKNAQLENFAPALIPENLPSRLVHFNAEILHLHWVADAYLRLETFRKFRKPLVWTLHDMWAFTGGCFYSEECHRYTDVCGCCPVLGSRKEKDLSRWVFRRKLKNWQNLDLTVVAPSNWLAECARKSALFERCRVEVIPNGIDVNVYRPIERTLARRILNLPEQKKIVLFGALSATSDQRKGYHLLKPALQRLRREYRGTEDVELVVFGAEPPEVLPDLDFRVHYVGKLYDDPSLAMLYSAADVFVAPSVQDNLPNTVLEALACGTPCVAFDIGGMPDMITHKVSGYLAKPYETEDLSRGVSWVLEDDEHRQKLGQNARIKVESDFALEKIAGRYLELYQEILSGGTNLTSPTDGGDAFREEPNVL